MQHSSPILSKRSMFAPNRVHGFANRQWQKRFSTRRGKLGSESLLVVSELPFGCSTATWPGNAKKEISRAKRRMDRAPENAEEKEESSKSDWAVLMVLHWHKSPPWAYTCLSETKQQTAIIQAQQQERSCTNWRQSIHNVCIRSFSTHGHELLEVDFCISIEIQILQSLDLRLLLDACDNECSAQGKSFPNKEYNLHNS